VKQDHRKKYYYSSADACSGWLHILSTIWALSVT
jgi:hypothetical protein